MPIRNVRNVRNRFFQYVADVQEDAIQAAITILNDVGLECVKEARTGRLYKDQTGNLRSSTGYAVLYNGKIQRMSSFPKVKNTAKKGKMEGKKLLLSLIAEQQSGLALIVVAGMGYAKYVEAKALNALNSAEDLARRLVPEMLREAGLRK